MKRFMAGIVTIDKSLYVIAGIVLACMIILTLFDVILRNLHHPITGSMEFIQYGGSIVFGFSIPYGTLLGAQVIVDIITEKLSPGKKRAVNIITRCIRHSAVPVYCLQFLPLWIGRETYGRAHGQF